MINALPGFEPMDANLRATLRGFCAGPDAEVELDGLAIRFSGENFAMFNAAVIASPVHSLDELSKRIRTAADYFRRRGVAWSAWACESWFEGELASLAPIAFSRCGLRFVLDLPAMTAARPAGPARELPWLEYRRVSDAASRAVFAQMMTECFGIPAGVARAMYERERLWDLGFTGWLGLSAGAVVSVAATMVDSGIAGVYSVATLPSFERHGCGEAIVRHALSRVREETGIEATALQSSSEGFSLYRRMGYQQVARYVVWASA